MNKSYKRCSRLIGFNGVFSCLVLSRGIYFQVENPGTIQTGDKLVKLKKEDTGLCTVM